jgi:cytoskeletal protein RodZ
MRLVLRIDLHHLPICAALCGALALTVLSSGVRAQESSQGQTASATKSVPVTDSVSTADVAVTDTSRTAATAQDTADSVSAESANTSATDLAGAAFSVPADAAPQNDISLDDQVLSRQRGGFSGMLMVAATPQLMRSAGNGGNGVTLWDEIAPPSPLPIPLDAAANAQGNVAAYQRK